MFDTIEFKEWLNRLLESNKNIPKELLSIINLKNGHERQTVIKMTAYLYSEFMPISEEGELIAIEILEEESMKFLNQDITPLQFCEIIRKLDANFLDLRNKYPDWLGNLYNECECCDESWTFADCPCLANETKINLENIINNKRSTKNMKS